MPSWTLADIGNGTQVSRVEVGAKAIDLAAADLWAVRLCAAGADEVTLSFGPGDCSEAVGAAQVVWTHPEGSTVTVDLTEAPDAAGSIATPTVVLAGAHLAGYVIDSVDMRAAVDCSSGGPWRLRWPELGGEVVPDVASLTARELAYPSFCSIGGALHGLPYAYVYQRDAQAGLWVGAVHGSMNGRYLRRELVGSTVVLRLRLVPPGNRTVTSWAAPYGLELVPLTGTYFHADKRWEERGKAAGVVALATPIREAMPVGVDSTDIYVSHLTGEPVDPDQVLRDMADLLDILKVEPGRVSCQPYRWHAQRIGDTWPDEQFPPRAGAEQLVTDLTALGVRVVPYTMQHAVHESAPSYASQGWANEIVRTPSQGIHYRALGGATGFPEGLHAVLDFDSPTVRAERQSWWRDQLIARFGAAARGAYFDAIGAVFGMANYRAGLPASKQGPGSAAAAEAWRAFLLESKALWHGGDAASLIVAEHLNDVTVGASDFVSDQGFSYASPDLARLPISYSPTVYSQYARIISFEGMGSIVDRTAFGRSGWPWLTSWRWHDGWVGSVTLIQGINDVRPPEGDPRRAAWDETMAPAWDFFRRMHVGLSSPARRFHTGRRLQPLPDGQEEDLIAGGWRYEVLFDEVSGQATYGFTTMKRVHSSLWLDPVSEAIGVFLSNWHPSLAGTQDIAITRDTHPELPTGRVRIVETDAETGRERVLDHFDADAGWHQRLVLPPRAVRHLRLEAAPRVMPRRVVGAWSTTASI